MANCRTLRAASLKKFCSIVNRKTIFLFGFWGKNIRYYSCIKELNIDNNKLYFLDSGLYNNENDNRLNINDNPLAFLLGLVDTIEPIKYFCVVDGDKKGEIDKEKIIPTLEDISIQVDLERNSIVISSNNLDLTKWHCEKIKDMQGWLNLTTYYDKKDKNIIIKI